MVEIEKLGLIQILLHLQMLILIQKEKFLKYLGVRKIRCR